MDEGDVDEEEDDEQLECVFASVSCSFPLDFSSGQVGGGTSRCLSQSSVTFFDTYEPDMDEDDTGPFVDDELDNDNSVEEDDEYNGSGHWAANDAEDEDDQLVGFEFAACAAQPIARFAKHRRVRE